MTSINSLTGGSSSKSIYGSRNSNIISGLASGLDTEEMLQGLVQGYQQKINKLNQDRTKIQWKQEAYQSISDKMVEFSRKYMSYTSSTNLLSNSFFNNAVLTTTNGKFADKISATGKTNSTIMMNAVAQLATAARYSSSAVGLNSSAQISGGQIVVSGAEGLDLNADMTVSDLQGTLKLKYGNKDVSINFDELEFIDDNKDGSGVVTAEKLQETIVNKLKEQRIYLTDGTTKKASELIDVKVDAGGNISFTDKSSAGNSVTITGASGKIKDTLGLASVIENKGSSFQVAPGSTFSHQVKTAEFLSDKSISFTLDGTKKNISLENVLKDSNGAFVTDNREFQANLNSALEKAFGAGKITATVSDKGALSFAVRESSTLSVSSTVGDALKIGSGLNSFVDTSRTLGTLGSMGGGNLTINGQTIAGRLMEAVPESQRVTKEDGTITDAAGNKLDADGYRLDRNGGRLYEFDLNINGVKIGSFTQETSLNTIMNSINANTEAGVNVTYSQITNQFVFTAKETGEQGRVDIGDGLGKALFGQNANYTAGQDAIFQATVNGEKKNFTRSSNTFNIDGMSITLKDVFNNVEQADPIKSSAVSDSLFVAGEAVSFTSKSDADSIVETVKTMVQDYNTIVEEVKKAYSTQPLKDTNGKRYEPLTADDRADLSESEIKAYEEKAKTGLLFADSDMSSLYNALRNAVTPGGETGALLRSIGIKTSYSEGLTTIDFDEAAFREALEKNPDQVRDIFTQSKENGAESDGLMASIHTITERYAKTTGEPQGILVEKAGSKYSPSRTLQNTFLKQMDEIDKQIERWQGKLSDKVDYYTNKFTKLEVMIQQMNSQSSSLAGLMGGY